MGLFSRKIPRRKWIDIAPALGMTLKAAGNDWYPTFRAHTAANGLTPTLTDPARHYIAMLQLSSVAATIVENGYVSDPTFFLELVYIAMTGRPPAQMHVDVEKYQTVRPRQTPDDPRASLIAWATVMASESSTSTDKAELAAELVSYGALLVVQAKISACVACGDQRGAERVRRAVR